MTRETIPCPECSGSGVTIEFRRFAGEYMAGEPVEVECEDCCGAGLIEDDVEDGKPIEQVLAESPELQAHLAEVRAKSAASIAEWNIRIQVDRELKRTIELNQRRYG
jgi:hypothetical protein